MKYILYIILNLFKTFFIAIYTSRLRLRNIILFLILYNWFWLNKKICNNNRKCNIQPECLRGAREYREFVLGTHGPTTLRKKYKEDLLGGVVCLIDRPFKIRVLAVGGQIIGFWEYYTTCMFRIVFGIL